MAAYPPILLPLVFFTNSGLLILDLKVKNKNKGERDF